MVGYGVVSMKSKHRSAARRRRPQSHVPPRLAPPRQVLKRLFPQPYLVLGTAFGDPVPAEWRVFKAEAENTFRHSYRVRVRS